MAVFLATLKAPIVDSSTARKSADYSGPQSERIKRCLDGGLRCPSASILVAILLLLNGVARSRRLGTKYRVGFADD